MKAIVYNSNTGFTAQYAALLSEATGIRAYAWEDAKKELPQDTPIIYLSWVMGNKLPGIHQVSERFYIRIIGAVGLDQSDFACKAVPANNGIPSSIPLVLLPGGLDLKKLNFFHRMMLKTAELSVARKVKHAVRPSENTIQFLDQLRNGCNMVDIAHLEELIEWAADWKEPK